MRISFELNGERVETDVGADEAALAVLRRSGARSVRESCGIGVCGSCTTVVDGRTVASCLLFAPLLDGAEVTTAEGFDEHDPVVRAFLEHHAFQCGYCTPGLVLAVRELLADVPAPSDEEVRRTLAGNLCRCGSYPRIASAVKRAAELAAGPGTE